MKDRMLEIVGDALDKLNIEIPSWGFANTGTRFGKFIQPTAATTIEEKFSGLEALGQILAGRLFEHARAGKADHRLRLGEVEIAQRGEAGRDAAHGRMRENGNEGQPGRGMAGKSARFCPGRSLCYPASS